MRLAIVGLGWFGGELAKSLRQTATVIGTTTTPSKAEAFRAQGIEVFELQSPSLPSASLLDVDALILNVPPFKNQLSWFELWQIPPSTHLIFISSTSVYGTNTGLVDENTVPIPETENALELIKEEAWVQKFPRHTIIRFGGLIGEDRHPGKYLSGRKQLSGGKAPVNLVHREDCVAFTELVLRQKLTGIFNLVYPLHPTRSEYYTTYCKRQGLPAPEFIMNEDSSKIVTDSQVSSLYTFKAPI